MQLQVPVEGVDRIWGQGFFISSPAIQLFCTCNSCSLTLQAPVACLLHAAPLHPRLFLALRSALSHFPMSHLPEVHLLGQPPSSPRAGEIMQRQAVSTASACHLLGTVYLNHAFSQQKYDVQSLGQGGRLRAGACDSSCRKRRGNSCLHPLLPDKGRCSLACPVLHKPKLSPGCPCAPPGRPPGRHEGSSGLKGGQTR